MFLPCGRSRYGNFGSAGSLCETHCVVNSDTRVILGNYLVICISRPMVGSSLWCTCTVNCTYRFFSSAKMSAILVKGNHPWFVQPHAWNQYFQFVLVHVISFFWHRWITVRMVTSTRCWISFTPLFPLSILLSQASLLYHSLPYTYWLLPRLFAQKNHTVAKMAIGSPSFVANTATSAPAINGGVTLVVFVLISLPLPVITVIMRLWARHMNHRGLEFNDWAAIIGAVRALLIKKSDRPLIPDQVFAVANSGVILAGTD